MNAVVSVASLASASAVAAPVALLDETEPDPVFAAIERHRELYAQYSAALRAVDEFEGNTYPRVHYPPEIPLYQLDDWQTEITDDAAPDAMKIVIQRVKVPGGGRPVYGRNAKQIKDAAKEAGIPEAERPAWIAQRRAELAQEIRRVRKVQDECGYTALRRRWLDLSHDEYEAGQALLEMVPRTVAGAHALIAYAVEMGEDLMPDGYDHLILLESVATALRQIEMKAAA